MYIFSQLIRDRIYLVVSLCFVVCAAIPQAGAQRPVNVLFIAVDDLKPSIGAFGDLFAVTPHLDRLADRGTAFINAHCQQAVCSPSRISVLTGLRPDTTKVWDLQTAFRKHLPDTITLPQRFNRAGYETIGMGKIYHAGSAGAWQEMDLPSWSQPFMNIPDPAGATDGYLNPEVVAQINRRIATHPNLPENTKERREIFFPNKRPPTDRADVPDEAYQDGAVTLAAIEQLHGLAQGEKPFFLAVGYLKPHLPFNAPEKYWQLYDRASVPLAEYTQAADGAPAFAGQPGWELRNAYNAPETGPISEAMQRELIHGYYAATSYIDAQVGMLLDTLDEQGLADNTIIVLWGDHGFHLGDHDIWCKHTNYEQATRAPLIIVAPSVGSKGQSVASPVEFVDIYPTLLELAGLLAEGELHGVSLVPTMKDPQTAARDVAVSQYPRGNKNTPLMGYAYRSDRYRLVQWRAMDYKGGESTGPIVATELYDYGVDPLETRNLANDPAYAQTLDQLQFLAEKTGYPPQVP